MSLSRRGTVQVLALLGMALVGIPHPVQADPYADIQAQLDDGRLREAARAAETLTQSNPADCRAWQLLGDADRKLGRIDQAISAYKKGLAACANDVGLLKALGITYDETENFEEAATTLGALWAIDSSDPSIGSRLGAACYRAGRCDVGKAVYEKLLAGHDERVNERMAYALLLARACNDPTAAEAEYKKLLAVRPNDPTVHCAYAFMLAEAGRVEEAAQEAQTGLAAVKETPGCLYGAWGRALEAGGDSLMVKGQLEPARELYRKAFAPLMKGISDPVFGTYCKSILAEVRYKEAPMEDLEP